MTQKIIPFLLFALTFLFSSQIFAESDIDSKITEYKQARNQAKLRAEIASRDADRLMTLDWLGYRQALDRQDYFEKQVKELDAKIAELEKQKKDAAGGGER